MNQNHFTLQGDSLEAFYQLGLSEKNKPSSSKVLKKMVLKNKTINYLSEKILGNTLSFPSFMKEELHQYIEGKGIKTDEFIQNFYLADVISSINSISPGALPNIGCSSGLVNDGDSIRHLRILDYPLGPFSDDYNSDLFFNIDNLNKVLTHSFTDIPLPALTSLNEHGLSLALHQRTSNKFNFKGSSIFELTSKISLQASTIEDSINMVRDFNSINNWSIILVSKKEKIAAEIETIPNSAPEVKKYDLSQKSFFYICNKSIQKNNENCSFTDNWNFYNSKRNDWVDSLSLDEKINNFFKLPKITKKTNFSHFPITPASIQSLDINLTIDQIKKISNSKVKYDDGQEKKYNINWGKSVINIEKDFSKIKKQSQAESFYESISLCQYYWDQDNKNKAFHYAQLCIDRSPSQELFSIASVFYSYFVFCDISNKKILTGQYKRLCKAHSNLPKFFCPDALLLINYYAHYLSLPSFKIDQLSDQHIFHFRKNKKIPKYFFKKIFKYLYIPRYEMFSFGKVNYLIDAVGSPWR
jgi:hypothetical protein